ncbi:SDR family oxidoreductase [Kribbella shirazensis]|nr:SDR family oxidoreductase [Kribbella shirazensis]
MAGPLENVVAVVTGASSGIGEATAMTLADLGARVALLARRRDRLEALSAKLGTDRALAIEADVTDPGSVNEAVAAVVAATGRIDVLVNNAGTGVTGPIEGGDVAQWKAMVDVNLLGVLHCTQAALPHLLQAAEGPRGVADVVTISSVAGRMAGPPYGVYAATKHAVGAFSEALRKEVAGRRVRVGLVEPGMVQTELTTDTPRTDFEWLRPTDVADAVSYLVTRPRGVAVHELLVRPTQQL